MLTIAVWISIALADEIEACCADMNCPSVLVIVKDSGLSMMGSIGISRSTRGELTTKDDSIERVCNEILP